MYDFHKQNRVSVPCSFYRTNSHSDPQFIQAPRANRGAQEAQHWHFTHVKFIRNRPDLVKEIRRKAPDAGTHALPYLPHDLGVSSPSSELKGGILAATQEAPLDLVQKVARLEQANNRLEYSNNQLLKAVEDLKTKVEQLFLIAGRGRTSPLSDSSNYSEHNHYGNYASPANHNDNTPTTSTSGQPHYQSQQPSATAPQMLAHNVPSSTSGSISSVSSPPMQYDNSIASPANNALHQFAPTINQSYQGGPLNTSFQSLGALSTPNQGQSSSGAAVGNGYATSSSYANQPRNTMPMQNAAGSSHSSFSNSATAVPQQTTQQSRTQEGSSARATTPTPTNPQPPRTHADPAYPNQPLGARGWPVAPVPAPHPHNSVFQSPGTAPRGSTNSWSFGYWPRGA